MKTLQDYIAETEEWMDDPQVGDAFDIELAPDHLIETVILETTADGIVIEADEHLESLLESRGWIGERIGTYGAVGYGGMGQTFFEKDLGEGGIDPNRHPQTRDYGTGHDEHKEPDDAPFEPDTKTSDRDQFGNLIKHRARHLARKGLSGQSQDVKDKDVAEGVNAKQIKKDLDTGMSHDAVIGKHANKRMTNTDEIRRVIQQHAWDKRTKTNTKQEQGVAEGAMKELAIELEDYKRMSPQEFERAYGMKKADWAMKHHDIIGKENLQVDWTGKTGFDYVKETSAYMARMLELAGLPRPVEEDQSAGVVAKKELDIDAARDLGEGSTCNMTAEGESCPVHGLEECGSIEEAKYQGREVKLGKPFLTPGGPKKRSVYVKNPKGNVVKVNFGDPNMRIKKSNPGRRKSFRSRHNCANPGPRHKARFWSCRMW